MYRTLEEFIDAHFGVGEEETFNLYVTKASDGSYYYQIANPIDEDDCLDFLVKNEKIIVE